MLQECEVKGLQEEPKVLQVSPEVPVQVREPQQVLSPPKLDLKCKEAFPELGSNKEALGSNMEASPAQSRKKEEGGERAGGHSCWWRGWRLLRR